MSQPAPHPRKSTSPQPGFECVLANRAIELPSCLVDDALIGAWNSLPDADSTDSSFGVSSRSLIERDTPVTGLSRRPSDSQRKAVQPLAPSSHSATEADDDTQRLVIPVIPRTKAEAGKPSAQVVSSGQPQQLAKAPTPSPGPVPSPASISRTTSAHVPTATPAPSRLHQPPRSFHQPSSRSSFSWGLNIDEVRKWGTSLAGVVIVSLAGYWGVSNVLGNSAPPMKTIPAKGTVTLNGKPAPGASVQLHPVQGSDAPIEVHPHGLVSESGQIEFTTFTPNDGIPAGEYIATISHMKIKVVNGETVAGPQLAPVIFTKPSTSPIRLKVSSDTRELAPIDFKKPAR